MTRTVIQSGTDPIHDDDVPAGMTTDQANRVQALVVELNRCGLDVLFASLDGAGKAFTYVKGDVRRLAPLCVVVHKAIKHVTPDTCTCEICVARRSEGAGHA